VSRQKVTGKFPTLPLAKIRSGKRHRRQWRLVWMPVDQIRVGKRHRKDMGDLAGLAGAMADIELPAPIFVRRDGLLACGERRLRAAKLNGETHVLAAVGDLTDDEMVRVEFSENIHRKDFTLSEAVAIKRALEPLERAAAKKRMLAGKPLGNLPKGRAADKVAKSTGMSRRTLERAEEVVDAAAAEPHKYSKYKEDMDRTGRVNGVHRRLKIMQQAERLRAEPPPWPGNGPYRVSVVDLPWPNECQDSCSDRQTPYPTMSIEQMCKLDVASRMHEDSIILMWVTNFVLLHGVHIPILKSWGEFEPKALITWPKEKWGMGNWVRSQTEHVVLAVRGKPVVESSNLSTLLRPPFHLVRKNAHSAKPREFYDFVEKLCPAPRYADLFSRYQHNDKWDCHGDQAPVLRAEFREAAE
jgi:ParB/RepB/Spo0J family partition protein